MLLFLDESGHDRSGTPCEVLAGVAVAEDNLWNLVRAIRAAEREHFGDYLRAFALVPKLCLGTPSAKLRFASFVPLSPPEFGNEERRGTEEMRNGGGSQTEFGNQSRVWEPE